MQFINNESWSTWTSLAYLAPSIISFIFYDYAFAILLVVMTGVSLSYHFTKPSGVDWWWRKNKSTKQILVQILDTALSIAIGFIVLKIILSSQFVPLGLIVVLLAIPAFVAYFCTSRYYEAYHGIWHITSALIIVLALII